MSDSENSKGANYSYMQNRELSWLEFNKRVLDQGADPAVPLFERLSFLSIFWSNLQEFFMIRVGSLTDLSLVKKTIIDSKSGMTPTEQLTAIYKRCHELYPEYEGCYKELRKEFAKQGIVNTRGKNLDDEQMSYIEDYFNANIMPFLSPQIVNSRHPFPHLENGGIYVIVRLDEEANKASKKKSKTEAAEKADKAASGKADKGKGAKNAKNVGAEGVTLGIISLPRQCKRVVRIPGKGLQFMLLEHLIEMFVEDVFSMYKVKHTNVICVTRNADLDATEGIEEQGDDYREHIKRILKKRTRLAPVRLESERELSQTVKNTLLSRLGLKNHQTFVTAVPLDMSYVYDLPQMVDPEVRAKLSLVPFTPQWPSTLSRNRRVIDQVCEREVLLSYPYETMDAFVRLLQEAVADPTVVSIKITLYRLAKHSHLAEALIAAAEAGKEVTAVFELRARFDEANNIEWSQRFEEAGCNVLYGFRDYKVHSKVCCITRQTERGLQYITQLGTGNYNEKTAKLYTDFSFMTTDPAIGRDVAAFFRNMTLENLSDEYREIWVAPLQIKQNICAGIDEQIANARAGRPAGLFFKTNSITDREVIDKIVEASQAGVQCTLLVRGISCIVPGIKGYTDNVAVVSIVGRLLEHSRIYAFGPFDGDCKIYLSSADLMTRNMDKRVEIAWPIKSAAIRNEVIGYIGVCMADTAKLRDLLPTRKYTELGFFAKKNKKSGKVELFDSQNYLIHEAERKLLEASENLAATHAGNPSAVRRAATVEIELEQFGEEASEFDEAAEGAHRYDAAQGTGGSLPDDLALEGLMLDGHTIAGMPNIEGLYQPEPNPEGKFSVPSMNGDMLEVERVGGPVPEDDSDDEVADFEVERDARDYGGFDESEESAAVSEGEMLEGKAASSEGEMRDDGDYGDNDSVADASSSAYEDEGQQPHLPQEAIAEGFELRDEIGESASASSASNGFSGYTGSVDMFVSGDAYEPEPQAYRQPYPQGFQGSPERQATSQEHPQMHSDGARQRPFVPDQFAIPYNDTPAQGRQPQGQPYPYQQPFGGQPAGPQSQSAGPQSSQGMPEGAQRAAAPNGSPQAAPQEEVKPEEKKGFFKRVFGKK